MLTCAAAAAYVKPCNTTSLTSSQRICHPAALPGSYTPSYPLARLAAASTLGKRALHNTRTQKANAVYPL